MSAELCFTEQPEYILTKEYEEKPDIDKLFEIFVVIYKLDLPKWKIKSDELKESVRYIFFTKLEKAFKRFKLFGPSYAMLQRLFTDNEELYQLALKNDNIDVSIIDGDVVEQIEEVNEEVNEETKEETKNEIEV